MRRRAILLLLATTLGPLACADQAPRKYVVFFKEWSADIDGPAEKVVAEVAEIAKTKPGMVRVVGFADPTGTRAANELLSELRAQRVIDLLAENGVPRSRMEGDGKGSVEFAISAQESRRVEISFQRR